MAVVGPLSSAASTVRENPLIFLVAFVFALLGQSFTVAQVSGAETVGVPFVVLLFVYPFMFAGLIGLIDAGLTGDASVQEFLDSGRSNYLSMFGAMLLLGVAFVGLFIVLSIVGMIFSMLVIGGMAASSGANGFMAGVGLVGLVFAVAVLVVTLLAVMFVQFFTESIVIDDAGAVDSLSASVTLVKRNFASVLGFSVLYGLLSLLLQAPSQLLYSMGTEYQTEGLQRTLVVTDESMLVASIVLGLVLGTLATGLLTTYHVAFYRSLRGPAADDDGSTASDARAAA